ncbi:SusC/RagA family TonB-linked outer membrane protein [Niabella insulamsoli]|uniref:SusC/RagA family TonB-linked outer membrane protein n=1 Tax=Niabella insulamsoli TaxID=3144874 RepID=UPI0031FDFD61
MKKTMQKMLLLWLMSCVSVASWAQQKTVTGTVTNEEGAPVAAASFTVRGTSNGGVTDEDGKFSVTVSDDNAVLEFSAIGYQNTEITVGRSNTLSVVLTKADATGMDEVVVTALGIKRDKKALGYAVTSLKGEDLVKAGNTMNPLTSLYGQAAGVGISVGSAGPTGGVNIKIRGSAGLQVDTKTRPLIVVDGVPIYDEESNMASRGFDPLNSFDYGSGINDINGEDIESIEILKGAKASVLYGSRAGNGVIMITTKKGKNTRGLGINFSYQNTFEKPVSFIEWQNEFGTGTSVYDTIYGTNRLGQRVRVLNNGRQQFGPAFDNSPIMNYDSSMTTYKGYPNNWIDLFQTTNTDVYSVAIAGANEKGNMRLGYTRKDYKGQLDNFFQKSNTISFNGQMQASDLATFELNANLFNVVTQNRYPNLQRLVSYGFNRDIDYQGLAYVFRDSLGQQYRENPLGLPVSMSDATGYTQILWEQNANRNIDNKTHFVGAFKVNLKFTPWLSFTGSAGTDYTDWNFTTMNAVTRKVPTVQGGSYAVRNTNTTVMNYNGFLNVTKDIADFDIFAFVGAEYSKTSQRGISRNTVGGLLYPDWYSINASRNISGNFSEAGSANRSSQVLYSVLGSASIGYKNTYYAEFSARNDWSSLLEPGKNSYFYPGASLTWNFNQTFEIPKLRYGKLRFSWADVGRGAPSPYFAYNAPTPGTAGTSQVPTIYAPGSVFPIEGIRPERNREFETGFETRWFEKTPLEIDFSFYTGNTYDQIMALGISNATGWPNTKINAGNVKKWGYELFAKFTPILNDDWKWDVYVNAANQRSKVVKLYPGITSYSITGGLSYAIMADEGKPIGEVRAIDYLRDPNGNKIVSSTGTYTSDPSKLVNVANINPKFLGGFGTDLAYKNISLRAGLDYKFGGTYLSYSNYYLLGNGSVEQTLQYRDEARGGLAYYIDASGKRIPWQHNQAAPAGAQGGRVYHDGVIQPGVKEVVDGAGNKTYVPNDIIINAATYYGQFIHDVGEWFQPDYFVKNDYIKFRELSLMYTLPKSIVSKIKLQKLSVSLIARNLFYLYRTIPHLDPESALGSNQFVEYSPYPQMRSYGFKIDVSF